jgi:hypothetical protein
LMRFLSTCARTLAVALHLLTSLHVQVFGCRQ